MKYLDDLKRDCPDGWEAFAWICHYFVYPGSREWMFLNVYVGQGLDTANLIELGAAL